MPAIPPKNPRNFETETDVPLYSFPNDFGYGMGISNLDAGSSNGSSSRVNKVLIDKLKSENEDKGQFKFFPEISKKLDEKEQAELLKRIMAMGEADAADYLARQESFSKIPETPTGPNIVMKKKPKKPEPKKEKNTEDDRPKALKDYLKEFMSDGDALIALGGALARGEGLVGGLEEYSKERKATKALELAAADKLYERERQKKLDEYTIATQQMDIAYKQSQMTTDDMKNAEYAAASQALAESIDIDDPNISSDKIARYYQILNEKMDMIINKEKPMTSADLIEQFNMQALQKALGTEDTSTGASGKTYKIINGKLVVQ